MATLGYTRNNLKKLGLIFIQSIGEPPPPPDRIPISLALMLAAIQPIICVLVCRFKLPSSTLFFWSHSASASAFCLTPSLLSPPAYAGVIVVAAKDPKESKD